MTNQNESLLGIILSCQTPNDPDKWRKPAMNQRKILTDDEIRNFIIKVEDSLNLPLGVLSMPGKGKINGHLIPAVKQAVIFHLFESNKVSHDQLAPHFGVKRIMVGNYIRKAKDFKNHNDEIFGMYYTAVQNIAV
jgi:hypothetical protein